MSTTEITPPQTQPVPDDHLLAEQSVIAPEVPEVSRRRMPEGLRRWGRRVMVAGGIYSSLASGGLIDKAIDPVSDAGDHVETLVDVPAFEVPTVLDGIPFSEYPPDAQLEILQERRDAHDNAVRAEKSVAQTMSDLDSHQPEGIVERAKVFEERYKSELFGEERTEETLAAIGEAETKEEAVGAFEEFLSFYNLNLELGEGVLDRDEGVLKSYMSDTVRAMAPLPKSLLTHEFGQWDETYQSIETIRLASTSEMNEDTSGAGIVAGTYSRSQRTINLGIPSSLVHTLEGVSNRIVPNWAAGNEDTQKLILHELAHGIFPSYTFGEEAHSPNALAAIPSFAVRDILGIEEHQTPYGQVGGPSEDNADAFANVFALNRGVSHPDQARDFLSKANEDRLKMLMQFEQHFPGLTDYLVANNQNLIGRQVFDIR